MESVASASQADRPHKVHLEILLSPATQAPPNTTITPKPGASLSYLRTLAQSCAQGEYISNATVLPTGELGSIEIAASVDARVACDDSTDEDIPDTTEIMLHVSHIRVVVDEDDDEKRIAFWRACFETYVYTHQPDTYEWGYVSKIADVRRVPCAQYEGVWESIHFSEPMKGRMLGYMRVRERLLSGKDELRYICCNGVILLHGPPGGGKTSICGALGQKMGIRMGGGVVMVVRLEQVLSKWFSESGQNVDVLFECVRRIAKEERYVMVILDEVETICMSRAQTLGKETGDGIRVVNSLLKGIDGIQKMGNVCVLCTSNLVDGVDEAFRDRADVCVKIGMMGVKEREKVLKGCVEELVEKGVVECVGGLTDVAMRCEGFSGRQLCRLPVLAVGFVGEGCAWDAFERGLAEAARVVQNGW